MAINSNPKKLLFSKFKFILKNSINPKDLIIKSINISKKMRLRDELSKIKNYGNFAGRVINVEHHESHIASSYYISNFKESCGVSVDGSGDFTTTSNSICNQDNIFMKDRILYPHSLGIFYTAISNFLGFDKYGEEFKVMALGAYGNSSMVSKLEELINFENNGKFTLNLDYYLHHKNINTFKIDKNEIIINELLNIDRVEELLKTKRRNRNEELNNNHFNLANSLQNLFEKAYLNYINFTYDNFDCDNLCIAGGCAMNSLANGKILNHTKFNNIFIQPAAYDAGGAIGAAMVCAKSNGQKIYKDNNQKLYLGPSYSNNYIEDILKYYQKDFDKYEIGIKFFDKDNDLIEFITNLLEKKNIIGLFRDRLEWGARALGNRSIIADPRGKDIKDMINKKIKRRESFRPFAPMVMYECVKDWFLTDKEIPSMMEVYKILDNKKTIIPAVVHKDDTCRLQTVKFENNEFIHSLLKNFNNKTGVPILLNTSFNENEPIVCKPEDAINTFLRVNMDALVLENFILLRKKS